MMPGSSGGIGTGQDAPGAFPVNWMQKRGRERLHQTRTP
jgi:hypothetical protein